MNNNTNENNDYPKTGTPAHNNSRPRGIDSASPLTDKYPPYAPDPACMDCGGEGKIWVQVTRYSRDDEPECLDYEWEPCDCIFEYMTVEADKACPACKLEYSPAPVRLMDDNEWHNRRPLCPKCASQHFAIHGEVVSWPPK